MTKYEFATLETIQSNTPLFAYALGTQDERERVIQILKDYFELTQMPDDEGKIPNNPEWDNGFQAAIALLKGNKDGHTRL